MQNHESYLLTSMTTVSVKYIEVSVRKYCVQINDRHNSHSLLFSSLVSLRSISRIFNSRLNKKRIIVGLSL